MNSLKISVHVSSSLNFWFQLDSTISSFHTAWFQCSCQTAWMWEICSDELQLMCKISQYLNLSQKINLDHIMSIILSWYSQHHWESWHWWWWVMCSVSRSDRVNSLNVQHEMTYRIRNLNFIKCNMTFLISWAMTCDLLITNSSSENIEHSTVIHYYLNVCLHNQYTDDDSYYVMSAISENWFYVFCEYKKLQSWNYSEEEKNVCIINSYNERCSQAVSWNTLEKLQCLLLILKRLLHDE